MLQMRRNYHNQIVGCYEINVQKEDANIFLPLIYSILNKCGND